MCADTESCARLVLQETLQADEAELHSHPESMEEICTEDTISQG